MAAENTVTGKVCPGDCLQCNRVQQLYCASQGNIEIHKSQNDLLELLRSLIQKVDNLTELVTKFEGDGPAQVVKKGKAPKSSGADN